MLLIVLWLLRFWNSVWCSDVFFVVVAVVKRASERKLGIAGGIVIVGI